MFPREFSLRRRFQETFREFMPSFIGPIEGFEDQK